MTWELLAIPLVILALVAVTALVDILLGPEAEKPWHPGDQPEAWWK